MIRFWELQTNYFLVTSNFLPSNQISSFLAARILLLWFSPETIFVVAKFTTNVANHGNLISRCCCCADFGKKETHTFLSYTIWPFFSELFQHKEIRRKLYSMSCIGIFWEWMNFWEWFQCLYVISTCTNVQKPSEYLYMFEGWSWIMFCEREILLLRRIHAEIFSHLKVVFPPLKWINADQGSKLLLEEKRREKDRCTFNAVLALQHTTTRSRASKGCFTRF